MIQKLDGLPVVPLTTWDQITSASSLLVVWGPGQAGSCLIGGELLEQARRLVGAPVALTYTFELINAACRLFFGDRRVIGGRLIDTVDLEAVPATVVMGVPLSSEQFAYYEMALPVASAFGGCGFVPSNAITAVEQGFSSSTALPLVSVGKPEYYLTFRHFHRDVDFAKGFELLRGEIPSNPATQLIEKKLRKKAAPIISGPFWDRFSKFTPYVDHHYMVSSRFSNSLRAPQWFALDVAPDVNADLSVDMPVGGVALVPVVAAANTNYMELIASETEVVGELHTWLQKIDVDSTLMLFPTVALASLKRSIQDLPAQTAAQWAASRSAHDGAGGAMLGQQAEAQRLIDEQNRQVKAINQRSPYRVARCLFSTPGSLLLGCLLMDAAVGSVAVGTLLSALSGGAITSLDQLDRYYAEREKVLANVFETSP